MNFHRCAAVSLLAAFLALTANAQLVHISATSDRLFGELVGYPPASEPMAGRAQFDLYYDASVVGTNGVFSFTDPTKNYWTLKAVINPDGTQPDLPLNEVRSFSFPLQTLALVPSSDGGAAPGTFALRAPAGEPADWWFEIGLIPSTTPTALPVPPFAFGKSSNYFNVSFAEEGWAGDHIIGGTLRDFSAEIITPVPEPSSYGLLGGIAALCFIVYHQRRRADQNATSAASLAYIRVR